MNSNPFQSPNANSEGPRKRVLEPIFYAAIVFIFIGGATFAVALALTAPLVANLPSPFVPFPAALLGTLVGGLAGSFQWRRIDKTEQARVEYFRQQQELIDQIVVSPGLNAEQPID